MTHPAPPPDTARPRAWLLAGVAVLLAVASVLVIWVVAVPVGPDVCAAIYPPARNCFEADRAAKGAILTLVLAVLALATTIVALLPRTQGRGRLMLAGLVLLGVGLLISYPLVAWIPALA